MRNLNAGQAERRDSGREPDASPERAKQSWELLAEITEARKSGATAESARELLDRFIAAHRDATPEGHETEADACHRIAESFEQHDRRMSRYWELLSTINGWPQPQTLSMADTEWLVAALRSRAS